MDVLVKKEFNLNDTINLISHRVSLDYNSPFIIALCENLNSNSDRLSFLKRLQETVHRNVKFKLDPEGVERVYRPETTWTNGTGDCKKMTVIICSALKQAGINCYLKHVFYKDSTGGIASMTHVYTIVPYPNSKGYITLDPAENATFDNEVHYDSAKIYDLNGIKMEEGLYTGYRNKYGFKSSLNTTSGAIMDDLSTISGNRSQEDNFMLLNIMSQEPETISGMGKKTKEQKKENRKKILSKFEKVGLAAPRVAFLVLVRLNIFKLATRLVLAWKKDKNKVENLWKDLGGNPAQLKLTIINGSGGENISGFSVAQAGGAAAIATATPIILAITKLLKEMKVSLGKSEDDLLDQGIDNAEELAASDATTPKTIVTNAGHLSPSVPLPPGKDSPESITSDSTAMGGDIISLSEMRNNIIKFPFIYSLYLLRVLITYSVAIIGVITQSPKFFFGAMVVTALYYLNEYRKKK